MIRASPHKRRQRQTPRLTKRSAMFDGELDTRDRGVSDMARFEIPEVDSALLGDTTAGTDIYFALGMMYSVGRSVPIDLVSAHKWFNLAAARGNADATALRREVAEQMSESEIAMAQRAARAWMTTH
jgi:TPR repeat protein